MGGSNMTQWVKELVMKLDSLEFIHHAQRGMKSTDSQRWSTDLHMHIMPSMESNFFLFICIYDPDIPNHIILFYVQNLKLSLRWFSVKNYINCIVIITLLVLLLYIKNKNSKHFIS